MTDRFTARPYTGRDREAWDRLVSESWNGTFLHSRRFLTIAAPEFRDRSLVIEERGSLVGVLPAADHVSEPATVESHPGSSYGGVVHAGALGGTRMLAALEQVADRLFHDGAEVLRYKAVPAAYQRVLSQDDLYAMYRLGAVRPRCELAAVIDVVAQPAFSRRRRRGLLRARRAGVRIDHGRTHLPAFWSVLTERLQSKHQAKPTHTLDQVVRLHEAFPTQVGCTVAVLDGVVVAGAVIFDTGTVRHAHYLGADDRGYATAALDLVIEHAIGECRDAGRRFLSLGTVTLYGGRVFNDGLHRYKSEFGAGALVHDTWDVAIT